MQKHMTASLNGAIEDMLTGSVAGNVNFSNEGGSTVVITPTLSEGTKIAEFTIDGDDGELYAPTPTEYSAGDNISISDEGVISATDTTYTAGNNVQISNENVISATNTTYTAGTGINISNENVISASGSIHTFSTTEHIIGKWIDNSDIYEITINLGRAIEFESNSWKSIDYSTSNISAVIDVDCFGADGTYWATLSCSISESNVRLNNSRSTSVYLQYVTLRYIK